MKDLQAHLDRMKDVRTLAVKFVCEKRLAALDSPLVSSGRLWIRKGDAKTPGAIRFSTQQPYLSELIIADGKIYGRSQHEEQWTTNEQSKRPGLSGVMVQLGGWSTGEAGAAAEMYEVERLPDARVPLRPATGGSGIGATATRPADDKADVDVFRLVPKDKDFKAAVKDIEVALDRATGHMLSIAITSAQGDVTRYWFYDAELNGTGDKAVGPDLFKPGAAAPK
jgi:outer membrane lipoprotein-sorting protein